jgi:C-terminal processing protease CtpA/Prc
MKKIVVLLMAFVFCIRCEAQTSQQVKNLTTLAQVWGFLKYYHPAAGKGVPDWDAELMHMIPRVNVVQSDKDLQILLRDWYYSLPAASLSNNVTQPKGDSVIQVFSEKDIQQFAVSKELKQAFIKLYQYHQPDSNRYITNRYKQYVLDYVLHTEPPFAEHKNPTAEMRLLSLFRYWNVINYFYPHKQLIPKDWKQVLTKYIPVFLHAADSTTYRIAVHQLTREIHDSHSFFANKEWDKRTEYVAPFSLYYLSGKYVIGESKYDSLMKSMDLKLGDEITVIDGINVRQREHELLNLYNGTNTLSKYRNVATYLLAGADSSVKVVIKRGGKYIEKEIGRYTQGFLFQQRSKMNKPLWKQIEPGIWYVDFCSIRKPDTLQRLFYDIKDAKSVIWDMRGYPSYPVTVQMGRGFFSDKTYLEDNYNASLHYPGVFTKQASFFNPQPNDSIPIYNGRLIVLVNEYSQSLSESVASALRARKNTLVMGRQTAGTTGNITYVDLPGNIKVSFTSVGVAGANGSFAQKLGVKIDKPVSITAEKLQGSSDYVLDEAIKEARR